MVERRIKADVSEDARKILDFEDDERRRSQVRERSTHQHKIDTIPAEPEARCDGKTARGPVKAAGAKRGVFGFHIPDPIAAFGQRHPASDTKQDVGEAPGQASFVGEVCDLVSALLSTALPSPVMR